MKLNKNALKLTAAGITSALLLTLATNSQAAIYDFTSGGTSYTEINGSGYGNGLDYGNMTATAWATTGVPTNVNYLIDESQIHPWSTGLGACNKNEGLAYGGCTTSSQHQVDNVGDDDYVLFLFDQAVSFENIVIDPYFTSDRDVSFWVGNITGSGAMMGLNPGDLDPGSTNSIGFNPYNQKSFYGKSSSPETIDLTAAAGGNTGNALLFAARANPGGYDNDYFKIASLEVTVVPVPAAVWLFGSGLIGLVGLARRKSLS